MRPRVDGSGIRGGVPAGRRRTARRGPARGRSPARLRSALAVLLGLWLLGVGGATATVGAQQGGDGQDSDGIEYFEKAIRPVLAERCSPCHGARVKKPKGGLVLGTRDQMLQGGDSGPAIVPGDPESSLLIQAIRYHDEALRMPPKGRLAPEQVAAFESWVKRGAPAPDTAPVPGTHEATKPAATGPASPSDHWSFRPPREPAVPARDPAESPIDAFLRLALKKAGLPVAPPADRRTLIRRASFDLTGLPPQPAEVEAFLADQSPEAFAKVIDRLLASPRYGEHWARHWLDLVRYTDEFNEVWRYRDWVIRAFNADLPYDQFLVHQVAGDQLPAASPGGVNADGIIATTMLAIGPWGGIDRPKRLADIVDDQIDIIGRSFLGLTIACARCHDHKFDPIATADYYGLAGFFFSSRILSDTAYISHTAPRLKVPLATAAEVAEHRRRMAEVDRWADRLQASRDRHFAAFARSLLPRVADYLLASWDYRNRPADQAGLSAEAFARRHGLRESALRRWVDYLDGPRVGEFHRLDQAVRDFDGEPGVEVWRAAAERPWWSYNSTDHDVPIETFVLPPRSVSVNPGVEGGSVGWKSPLAATVRIAGRLTDADPHDGAGVAWTIDHLTRQGRCELSSGVLPNGGSQRLDQGRLASRLDAVRVEPGDVIQLQVALAKGDAHYDITNVELTISAPDRSADWNLARDVGANFLASNPHADSLGNPGVWQFDDRAGSHRAGRMPAVDHALADWDAAGGGDRPAIERAARRFAQAVAASCPEDALVRELAGVHSPFWSEDLRDLPAEAQAQLKELTGRLEAARAQVPPLSYASGIQDGGPRYGPYPGIQDARIYIRGSYTQPGRRVPRHFPAVLAGPEPPRITKGSGRLELARWIARPDNPLTARVMVNRIWQHHFGAGLVRTPSNFGRKGEPPTHPELLDWLALRFVELGWSIKAMHRLIMLSAAYQRSSQAPAALLAADPENRLWGRMNRRRLEAEELFDSLLALAGRLRDQPGGPAESDPASPRRLIYRATSRSNRSDFGSVFDRANPALHVERRTLSTVAPQALYLMNHPWVMEQARGLARRPEIAAATDPARRIDTLHRLVFGRSATAEEITLGRGFLAEAPATDDAQAPWDAYAHALLLTNEFLFVD
ncbi:MAG TPA: PSD1 and planctomycete cytochrome C domain-containing protein [Isosphaeraceae bacterium]|nr:PSD1 and planctomycete cytochrome C domain-containing protein [Isosphaeraceae bacterium]